MSDDTPGRSTSGSLGDEAARWVWRKDRGLTAAEQDAFSQWLAGDPRNGAEFSKLQAHWRRTYSAAEWRPEHGKPNPDLLAPAKNAGAGRRSRNRAWFAAASLPLAAGIAVAIYVSKSGPRPVTPGAAAVSGSAPAAAIEQRMLEDGSVVELDRGSIASVHFTPAERRVTLERGEGQFTVRKNPDRPFIVTANGVSVRAVGTAFDVRLEATEVDVLVTEGRVQIRSPAKSQDSGDSATIPDLEAGQRAVVPVGNAQALPRVAAVASADVDRFLAWQPRQLDFTAAPLSAIIEAFNRHNPVRLEIADPEIGPLKISATFPSDNVEGFVRLLEAGFNIRAERRGDGVIVLHKAE